jgi:hypothetical protein
MGKKGMSADDKKSTVLRLFHESKRPFTLKEMEKLASKNGVVQNTVKDVLKDLTDDVSFLLLLFDSSAAFVERF